MSRTMSRRAVEQQQEHDAVLAAIRGETAPVGQCDGCEPGHSVLCKACGLCRHHCLHDGCGYSPHAAQVYDLDQYENC